MTLSENHLEQITLSAQAIAELTFPPPRIFTNALLGNHEITALIRDTEPHERALFSIDPNAASTASSRRQARRGTTFPGEGYGVDGRTSIYTDPRKGSAVVRALGGDMLREIQQSNGYSRGQRNGTGKEVDIEVLLQGAEKLCAVYPIAGANEKITSLRTRHQQISESIEEYDAKVQKQQARLDKLNKGSDYGVNDEDEKEPVKNSDADAEPAITEEDLRMEQQEIRELEMKKRALEERVAGMEKDLGGLLR